MTKTSFRKLQTEIDEVLVQLQSAELDIDKALDLYKKGQRLIKQMEDYLKTAKNEVTRLKK